jgi:hypothetical protein
MTYIDAITAITTGLSGLVNAKNLTTGIRDRLKRKDIQIDEVLSSHRGDS